MSFDPSDIDYDQKARNDICNDLIREKGEILEKLAMLEQENKEFKNEINELNGKVNSLRHLISEKDSQDNELLIQKIKKILEIPDNSEQTISSPLQEQYSSFLTIQEMAQPGNDENDPSNSEDDFSVDYSSEDDTPSFYQHQNVYPECESPIHRKKFEPSSSAIPPKEDSSELIKHLEDELNQEREKNEQLNQIRIKYENEAKEQIEKIENEKMIKSQLLGQLKTLESNKQMLIAKIDELENKLLKLKNASLEKELHKSEISPTENDSNSQKRIEVLEPKLNMESKNTQMSVEQLSKKKDLVKEDIQQLPILSSKELELLMNSDQKKAKKLTNEDYDKLREKFINLSPEIIQEMKEINSKFESK